MCLFARQNENFNDDQINPNFYIAFLKLGFFFVQMFRLIPSLSNSICIRVIVVVVLRTVRQNCDSLVINKSFFF